MVSSETREGANVAKDKKKKKKQSGADGFAKVKSSAGKLKAIADNPMVAEVVASALVATAAAMRDPEKARRFAATATDELSALSKKTSESGNAMWQLALEVGRRALQSVAGEGKPKKAKAAAPKRAAAKPKAAKKPAAKKLAAKKPATKKTAAKKPAARKTAARKA